MRIHWENGSRLYNSAAEASEDMRRRGYDVNLKSSPEVCWEKKLPGGAHWSRKDGDRADRVRERL